MSEKTAVLLNNDRKTAFSLIRTLIKTEENISLFRNQTKEYWSFLNISGRFYPEMTAVTS